MSQLTGGRQKQDPAALETYAGRLEDTDSEPSGAATALLVATLAVHPTRVCRETDAANHLKLCAARQVSILELQTIAKYNLRLKPIVLVLSLGRRG